MKPALLILNAWMAINNFSTSAVADVQMVAVGLKLSQEQDLDPGLVLPVAEIIVGNTEVAVSIFDSIVIRDMFHAQGTIWCPAWVGVRLAEPSTSKLTDYNVKVYLQYEVVQIPWVDWFLNWEWLDNIVNNEEQY